MEGIKIAAWSTSSDPMAPTVHPKQSGAGEAEAKREREREIDLEIGQGERGERERWRKERA